MSDKYPGGLVTAAAPAGYSVAFDGTGDYLTVPSNVALTLGTGNFCLEFWAYPTSFSATRSWLSNRNGTETNRWGIDSNTSGQFYLYGNGGFVVTSTVQTVNQWVHVCVTRAGTGSNQTRIFINGALSAVGTSSTDFAADIVSIGASPTGSQAAIGNVSNARIIKGSIPAEYTTTSTTVGAQIFSPPTQLFPVTNTSLLACQSPTIIDNSSNNFAITVAGNAAVSTFTPFPSSYYFYNAPTDGNTRNMLPSNIAGFNPAYGAAAPGVWTLDQAQYFTANRLWPIYDPYFNLTTLMLSGNQPSGVTDTNNNVFKDSSTNNFSITRNGNTTQGTFSPFSQTGWGNYFDGTGDFLSVASNTALDLGSGDYTIEGWWYFNDTSNQALVSKYTSNNGYVVQYHSGNLRMVFGLGGSSDQVNSFAWTPVANTWYHIAITRSGTSGRAFVNGTQIGTTLTFTTSNTAASTTLQIGSTHTVSELTRGYVSNFRLVKGTAVYTANFTTPTAPLTAITNTSLLTCQSNRFIDNSTNAFAITPNGDVSVQAFSPFNPTASWSAATNGGSGYFDGSGDYLTTTTSSAFDLSSGDWTIQGWYYPTAYSAGNNVVAYVGTSAGDKIVIATIGTGGGLYYLLNGSVVITGGSAPLNAWSFFALVKSGGTTTLYINGVSQGTTTSVPTSSNKSLNLGSDAGAAPYQGYIADFRILKGTANTAVPTAPLTAITNTSLLTNFTNAGIYDATSKNDLETVGNAQISTAQSKFGGSSMAFDGSGDWVQAPNNAIYNLGGGDFTIEFWLYVSSNPALAAGIATKASNSGNTGWSVIYFPGYVELRSGASTALIQSAASSISTTTWTHVAITRYGTSGKIFINGIQSGSTGTINNFTDSTTVLAIGALDTTTGWNANYPLNGYIDDLRITKGIARYTSNFTPPTTAFLTL